MPDEAEQLRLVARAQAGDHRARDLLLRAAIPGCIPFGYRRQPFKYFNEDRVQGALIGVNAAIDTFVPSNGASFKAWIAKGRIAGANKWAPDPKRPSQQPPSRRVHQGPSPRDNWRELGLLPPVSLAEYRNLKARWPWPMSEDRMQYRFLWMKDGTRKKHHIQQSVEGKRKPGRKSLGEQAMTQVQYNQRSAEKKKAGEDLLRIIQNRITQLPGGADVGDADE